MSTATTAGSTAGTGSTPDPDFRPGLEGVVAFESEIAERIRDTRARSWRRSLAATRDRESPSLLGAARKISL